MNHTPTRYSTRSLLVVLLWLGLVYPTNLMAQTSAWSNHTSMRRVNAIDATSTHIWTATRGGVFNYSVLGGEIETFTVVDGLHNVDVRAIATDETRDYVWVGYGDGVLDRISITDRTIVSFRDIERATQFASRGINNIVIEGDSVLIATQFGVVVFDPSKSEVRDAYTRLGDNEAATEVHDVLVARENSGARTIWAATENGVARAFLSTANLQDPSAWTVERTGFEAGSEVVQSLEYFEGAVYAGTDMDVYRRASDATYARLSVSNGRVTDLRAAGNRLLGAERFRLLVFESGGPSGSVSVEGFQDPVSIVGGAEFGYWFGDATLGLVRIPVLSATSSFIQAEFTIIPEGPYDGLFSDLTVDADGDVWAGGISGAGTGVYSRSDDGTWTTYSSVFYSELTGVNTFTRIHADDIGNVWAASVGGGVLKIDPEGQLTVFNHTNSSLQPATGLGTYLIAGGVGTEKDGTLWATTRASTLPLHVRTTDGTWTAFGPYVGQGLTIRSTAYDRVFVDSYNQKWVIVLDENNFQASRGLLVLSTGAPETADDDVFRFFGENGSAGQGLPGRAVRFVTEDRDGLIWVGTESGPAYFVNSGIVASDASARAIWPQWADRSQGTFMLFGLSINGIAVDPANQLWFATDNGAWLVRSVEGGYEVVNHFTSENSPLFSDEVLAVTVSGQTGEVYFSTGLGLVSYHGDAVIPSQTVRDLFVYPNPVRIEGNSTPDIYIDGLVEETDIRILTATGSLVRRLSARGGRIRWDGRDELGSIVSSGVYLIVAVGKEGSGAAHGKVAIIR